MCNEEQTDLLLAVSQFCKDTFVLSIVSKRMKRESLTIYLILREAMENWLLLCVTVRHYFRTYLFIKKTLFVYQYASVF